MSIGPDDDVEVLRDGRRAAGIVVGAGPTKVSVLFPDGAVAKYPRADVLAATPFQAPDTDDRSTP